MRPVELPLRPQDDPQRRTATSTATALLRGGVRVVREPAPGIATPVTVGTTLRLGVAAARFLHRGVHMGRGSEQLWGLLVAVGIFAMVAFWPYFLGTWVAVQFGAGNPSTARNVVGWVFEAPWALLLIAAFLVRSDRRKADRAGASTYQRATSISRTQDWNDWRGALQYLKGVYVIHDQETGQAYVGSRLRRHRDLVAITPVCRHFARQQRGAPRASRPKGT